MLSLEIFFLNHNKYAQNNKSIKYHFSQLTLTQVHLNTNTTNLRLFWKITLSGDPLCVIVSCQCNSGLQEAVTPGSCEPFIIIYKEFNFFLHTHIRKSLILTPKLHAPKIDETCPNCSRIVHGNPMFSFYNHNKHAQNNKST